MKTLSGYIKKRLEKEGRYQSDLAAVLHLTRQAMTYKFSGNKWSLEQMRAIASFFNMSLQDLIIKSGQK